MGESYAGTFIVSILHAWAILSNDILTHWTTMQPYIVKRIFASPSSPVTLRKIAIGNPALGSVATIRDLPVVRILSTTNGLAAHTHQVNILETYPAIIGYDQDVFNYFKEQ